MHHSADSLCFFACLFSSCFFISFLVPSSASSGLKRSPNRCSTVTAISVLEFSKQHSPLFKIYKATITLKLKGSQGNASHFIVPCGVSLEPLIEVKSVGRLGEKTVVNEGMCSYGLNVC